jgi:hypothetical protein
MEIKEFTSPLSDDEIEIIIGKMKNFADNIDRLAQVGNDNLGWQHIKILDSVCACAKELAVIRIAEVTPLSPNIDLKIISSLRNARNIMKDIAKTIPENE